MKDCTDAIAKAIYDERGRTGVGWMKWEEQTETVKDIWRGCALEAVKTYEQMVMRQP